MTSDPQQQPEHANHDEEIEVIKSLWNEYGKPITTAVLAALVVMGIFNFIKVSKQNKLTEASISLAQAKDADGLNAVIANYPDSPSAPVALMTLGSVKMSEGDVKAAEEAFKKFTTDYASHPMLPIAEINLANSLEAESNYAEALTKYDALIAKYPAHYIAPPATLGKARCLQQLDRPDEARVVLENLESQEIAAPYANLIAFNLDFVDKDIRKAKITPAVETTPPVETPAAE